MSDIIEYLNDKNIEYKLSGNEAILKCPNCNKKKLYINIFNGAYHCFRCEILEPDSPFATGHISQLQEFWGDIVPISPSFTPVEESKNIDYTEQVERYHYALLKSPKGLKYLYKRGITDESIARFKLGFTRRYNQDWISIPSYEDGIPKLLKFRKCPPNETPDLDKYIREAGGKTILFNGDCIKDSYELNIIEGEIDAITLIQNGYESTVGLTSGAGSFLPEWYDQLNSKEKFYIILDPDKVGQKAAHEVWATRLGLNRSYNILLPQDEDINSFFLKYNKSDFEKLKKSARLFKIEGIMSLKEALVSLHMKDENGELERYPTPWDSINKLLNGGIFKKTLTIVGGPAGVGKTSFSTQWMHYIAKYYQIPSLLFCLEMPEWSLAIKIIQLEKDLSSKEVLPSDALAYSLELEDLPIYFGYSPKMTPEKIYNTFKEARNRFGIEFFIFDNLQLLIRSDKESDMSKASGMFKSMAMELNIMMLVVSQPTKIKEEGTIINYDHLKGSSAIAQDADFAILLQRNREKTDGDILTSSFSPIARTIVDKARFASGGTTFLNFIGEKSKFIERQKREEKW